MGYLAELNETLKEIPAFNSAKNIQSAKSIAKGALDGTLHFPMLVSDSNPIGSTATLARTMERAYASFVQVVLSLNSTIDISVTESPAEYLKTIHKNIVAMESADSLLVDDTDEFVAKMKQGKYQMFVNESANLAVAFNMEDKVTHNLVQSNRKQLTESLGFVDMNPIANVSNSIFYEDGEREIRDLAMNAMIANAEAKRREIPDSRGAGIPKLMGEKEAKKLNDMQPYVMGVRLMAVNNKKEFVQFMDFAVGIKVVVHTIPSNEMIVNIASVLENRSALFNFIKWTTGEKSLVKDLLLNINGIKLDVANRSKGASGWWTTLKRIKSTANAQMMVFNKYKIVPNSTMVLTKYDVDYITKHYGYNLMDYQFAKKLMDGLFLMCFIVVDDSTDTVSILYDGQRDYQVYSLEVLDKETVSNNGKISKEIMRMINN